MPYPVARTHSHKSMPLVDDFSVRFFVISSTQISPNLREMISMPRQISIPMDRALDMSPPTKRFQLFVLGEYWIMIHELRLFVRCRKLWHQERKMEA